MIVHALNYAEDKTGQIEIPVNLEAGRLIERYGVEAVYGRPVLFLNEMRRMVMVENVFNAATSHKRAKDSAKWAEHNPGPAQILAEAIKIRHDDDNA